MSYLYQEKQPETRNEEYTHTQISSILKHLKLKKKAGD